MIIITGASGGVGAAILPYLVKLDSVVGLYNKKKPPKIENATFVRVDLLNSIQIKMFVSEYGDRLEDITIIHGAATTVDQLAVNLEERDWDQVHGVNIKSNYILTKALLPKMVEQKWGRIITLSSVIGQRGAVGALAYSSSKSGLHGLSRVYSAEYARFNITSNIISLGYFDSGLIETFDEEARKNILSKIPANKFGNISNIFNAVEFLIKSDYCNGSTISIDGGML